MKGIFKSKKRILGSVLGLIVIYLALSTIIQSYRLPELLRLSPGQEHILSVKYPLAIYHSKTFRLSTNRLVLKSQKGFYDIQVRVFGAIPIKKMRVEVVEPPRVIPGGEAIGVLFSSQGVVIVGHIPIKGIDQKQYNPAKDAGLKPGDILLAIDNNPVNRVDEVESFMQKIQSADRSISLLIKRDNKILTLKVKPVLSIGLDDNNPRYRIGIFIEDPAAGVGTLTFYEPETLKFAGLGHRIANFAGRKNIPFNKGEIVSANISGIKIGTPGQPGEKIGLFNTNLPSIGKIEKNNRFGIYGTLFAPLKSPSSIPIPIAYNSQIKLGPAEIYTVIKDQQIERFQVEIIKIFRQDLPRDKGLVIKVTDQRLLKITGGIIQGMSGSPIIQDGKLVGAVTHVFVNDPTKGYGVLAEWMIGEIDLKRKAS